MKQPLLQEANDQAEALGRQLNRPRRGQSALVWIAVFVVVVYWWMSA